MILKVQERLALLGLLPEQGDLATLKIVRQLRESLSLSLEEMESPILKVRRAGQPLPDQDGLPKEQQKLVPEGQLAWDQEQDPNKDFDFSPAVLGIIVDVFNRLNGQKKIEARFLDLALKFIG